MGRVPKLQVRTWALTLVAVAAFPGAILAGTGAATARPSPELGAGSQLSDPPGPTTLSSTGAEQTYVVPSGVTLLSVQAIGAGGGSTGFGGSGLELTAQLPVTPNEVLYAEVGQPGSTSGGTSFGGGGAPGTTSAGTTNANAGSGGGATDVRTCSETAKNCAGGGTSAGSRLIVAGGGGGGGGQGSTVSDVCGFSQSGGNAGAGNGTGGTVVTTSAGTVILGSPDATSSPSTPAGGGQDSASGSGGPRPRTAVPAPPVTATAPAGPRAPAPTAGPVERVWPDRAVVAEEAAATSAAAAVPRGPRAV